MWQRDIALETWRERAKFYHRMVAGHGTFMRNRPHNDIISAMKMLRFNNSSNAIKVL